MKALFFALLVPIPAYADFEPVYDRGVFEALVQNADLKHRIWPITLNVQSDGTINGSAMGHSVSGSWEWTDGYFCRAMDWSGTEIPFNCQLVEQDGPRLRFTVDRGQGKSAVFRID